MNGFGVYNISSSQTFVLEELLGKYLLTESAGTQQHPIGIFASC